VDGGLWPDTVPVDLKRLRSDIAFLEVRARWDRTSALERLGALAGSGSLDQVRWILPRLLGIRALARAKALLRRGR
jgi:hypothetical protein